MEKKCGVEIKRVANGYIVKAAENFDGEYIPPSEIYVYNDIEALYIFLTEHFEK